MNRYFKITLSGFILLICILGLMVFTLWDNIIQNVNSMSQSFIVSLAEDILFFGLVGVGIVLYQTNQSRGDILRKRVEYLFANSRVSYPAIEYIEGILRRNCVYSQETLHEVQILDYDPEMRAYRVSFHNTYHLKNLFGDIHYKADLAAVIAPDLIRDELDPLGIASSVRITIDGKTKNYLASPVPLNATGFKLPVELSLPKNGEAIYEMEWWSWASNLGNSGFSVKRFSEHTIVTIQNKSLVDACIYLPEDGEKSIYLAYNESKVIRESRDVPENTRLDFSWRPPKQYIEDEDPDPRGGGVHPILLSEDKV